MRPSVGQRELQSIIGVLQLQPHSQHTFESMPEISKGYAKDTSLGDSVFLSFAEDGLVDEGKNFKGYL